MIEGKSEKELQAIIDCAQDGIALLDLTGKVATINKRIKETAGYTEEEVVGKRLKLLKMFPPKSIATMLRAFAQVISNQQPPPYEVEVHTKTGEKLFVEIHSSLLMKGEEKAGVVAVLRDITKRRQLEASLLQERETFITILQHALYGVVLLDSDGKHVYVNPAFTAITGYTLEDIPTGKDWMLKAYPDEAYRKKVASLWKKDSRLGVTKRVVSVVCKKGETKEIEFMPTILKDGRAVVMMADITERQRAEEGLERHREQLEELVSERTAALQEANKQLELEIAERKQIEEELRESEGKYRSLVESSDDSIYLVDRNCNYIFLNNRHLARLGVQSSQAIGRAYGQFHSPKESNDFAQRVKKVLKTGQSLSYEYRSQRDNRYFIRTLSPVTSPDGGAINTITVISKDITEHKYAEEKLRESEERFRAIFETAQDFILLKDKNSNFTAVNPAMERLYGVSASKLIGKTGAAIFGKAMAARVREQDVRVLSGEIIDEENLSPLKGSTAIHHIIKVPIHNSADEIIGICGIGRDITERKQIEEELRESEERFRSLVETMKVGLSAVDRNGVITYVNEHFCNMLGYSMEEITGRPTINFYYDEEERKAQLKRFAQGRAGMREISTHEITWRTKEGQKLHTIVSPTPNFDKHNRYAGSFAVITDITERKQMEEALRESEERFRLLVEHSKDTFVLQDFDGSIIDVNQHACESLGYTREELLALNMQDIDQDFVYDKYLERWKQMVPGEPILLERLHRRKDGTTFPVEVRLGVLESGRRQLMLGLVRDITERVRAEETIRKLAYHDSLTGLPNRVLFANRLNRTMAKAYQNKSTFAVMSLDLDRFKDVNDTLGHSVGDQLLESVGKRLTGLLRKNDTVSRMGGDEFFLLLPEITHEKDASTIAQKVLGAFKDPFVLDNHELTITTSIGVVIYPDDGQDADDLLKHADIALYQAKQKGRNNYQHYTAAMEERLQGQVRVG